MARRWGPVVLAAGLAACGRCGGRSDSAPQPGAEPALSVPMPDSVLAVAYAPTPDATWEKVQRGIGGLAGILPSRVAGLTAAAADLDARLGEHVERSSPAIFVVGGELRAPRWVYAARLSDERKARAVLVGGNDTPFVAEGRPPSELLVPRNASRVRARVAFRPPSLLVVGSDEEALATLGPYAASELVVRPMGPLALTVDVPHRALADSIVRSLEARFAGTRAAIGRRTDASGRLLSQLLDSLDGPVRELAAVAADFDRVQVTAEAEPERATMELRATPRAGGTSAVYVSALRPGEPALLDDAPSDASAAVWSRSEREARAQWARAAQTALERSDGVRALSTGERAALGSLVTSSATARGDELVATWGTREDGAAAVVRMREGSRDAVAEVATALDTVVRAKGLPAAIGLDGPLSIDGGKVPGADLIAYRFSTARGGASGAQGMAWSILWGRDAGDVVAAAAEGAPDPRALLAVSARNGADAAYRALRGRLASRAQVAVVARPSPRRSEDPPAVAAFGRDGDVAWARIEVPWGVARLVEPSLTR